MTGLQRICKLYGGMTVGGVKYVWDYAEDKAVTEAEIPMGSERHKASDRAKWQRQARGEQAKDIEK